MLFRSDGTGFAPDAGVVPGGRVLWTSLVPPSRVLGQLLDESSFEGAWLVDNRFARIRLAGSVEDVPAPAFASDAAARAWLGRELARRASTGEAGAPQHAVAA